MAKENNTPVEEQNAGEEVVQHTSETPTTSPDDTSEAWGDVFPDKTPEEVKSEIQDWKKHSREWEKRAKSWQKKVDDAPDTSDEVEKALNQARDANQRREAAESELNMFRDLFALEIEIGTQVPVSQLADSIAFRDAYQALDRESDDFDKKLKEIVEKRSGVAYAPRGVEVPGGSSAGADLYDRMFPKNKEK
ncbi:hypothetical protein HMPREF3169_09725 [Corynebacterium sp. HMSC08C04]|uniref:hypothetical protein n=1 Tax=Corynebacterium sp. HMSC08C04 TaxID=1581137 RepID=UPI0008A536D8|nr:hypothetical protein [Corynebacterium sp. HMSC08C04]OFT32803.1 hypothetical protein HMPREF3169_09725 [Corynebacterium sp. HMSC08C04]